MNVTNTASAAGSKLIDLQVGGTTKFNVDKDSNLSIPGSGTFRFDGLTFLNNFTNYVAIQGLAGGAAGILLGNASDPNVYVNGPINFRSQSGATVFAFVASTGLNPGTNDGLPLGTTSLMWSDLFLASGGVINFNNGDVTITHASHQLTTALGTTTASAPFTINQTWNSSGVTFTGIVGNFTATAAANASLLLDLQNSGTSKFKVDLFGGATAEGFLSVRSAGQLILDNTDNTHNFAAAYSASLTLTITHDGGGTLLSLKSDGSFYVLGEVQADGEIGGLASCNTLTGTSDLTTNSTGVGTILFKGATNRNSSGFIKFFIGTTAYFVPVFSAITG